jgi:acyl-phosphate glycerol 3-phosphate acyltransferase
MTIALLCTILIAYLIGAVPFGYLVARARGVDIFAQGSGNIGATNVGRVLGRRFGILVFLLDFAKGAVPVAIARQVARATPQAAEDLLPVAAGLAAFLGHLFPIYLRFRGGKGVATGAGVVVVLVPLPALAALLTWVAVVCATRMVSLASLAAVTALCVFRLILSSAPFGAQDVIITVFCLVAAGLVFARHRANLGRLLHGTENRLKESPSMLLLTKLVHVLSLGLWFGSGIFFSFVVGLLLFRTFGSLTEEPQLARPLWLPAPPELEKNRPSDSFPEPLRKEQGSRIAGAAVGPMFPWYFGLQAVCGVLAVATALAWCSSASYPGAVHKVRVVVLGLALIGVGVGWWLEREVEKRRETRTAADQARADFGRWHGFSLMVNLLTVLLVTVGMALAAALPAASADGSAGVLRSAPAATAESQAHQTV